MALKVIMDSLSDIDSAFHSLYTEKNGKFHLTGIQGVKTDQDIEALQTSLNKERNDHKDTKTKLDEYKDIRNLGFSASEILSKLDRFNELELAAKDKIDDKKIDEIVETRIKTRLAPLERDLNKAKEDLAKKDSMISEFTVKEKTRRIHDAVREAATKSNVIPTAVEDIMMMAERVFDVDENGKVFTKDSSGVIPGIDPEVFLTEMQEKRPHWWPASSGGGSKGGSGSGFHGAENPFTHENWNLTKQGQLVAKDRAKAEQMAKAAGTTIGGKKPVAKS